MTVKGIIDEDFVNYKEPSMFISFPKCTFKCDKEYGKQVCQNSTLAYTPNIEISIEEIFDRYKNNEITSAIVCAGLEPFDSFKELFDFIVYVRDEQKCNDDIVIYSGYTEKELHEKLKYDCVMELNERTSVEFKDYDMFEHIINNYKNIIVKFGRFIPNQNSHHDEVLGVSLASSNQYAKRVS